MPTRRLTGYHCGDACCRGSLKRDTALVISHATKLYRMLGRANWPTHVQVCPVLSDASRVHHLTWFVALVSRQLWSGCTTCVSASSPRRYWTGCSISTHPPHRLRPKPWQTEPERFLQRPATVGHRKLRLSRPLETRSVHRLPQESPGSTEPPKPAWRTNGFDCTRRCGTQQGVVTPARCVACSKSTLVALQAPVQELGQVPELVVSVKHGMAVPVQ